MKAGFLREQLAMEWMPDLIDQVSRIIPDLQWVHDSDKAVLPQLLLDGDPCYPFKRMVRSSLSLLAEVDILILPRLVSLDGFLMCPNFRALPDIVAMNRERLGHYRNVPIVTPVLDGSEKKDLEGLVNEICQAILNQNDPDNLDRIDMNKNRGQDPLNRDISASIAIIGHPYVLADARLNNNVPNLIRRQGFDTVFAQEIPFEELSELASSHDYYAKKLYWRSAREAFGAFLYFTQIRRPAGIIHLVPFNCGVDALLRIEMMALHKRTDNAPPYMVIVCDEHTQRDHVVTRVEAFLDIVNGIKIN